MTNPEPTLVILRRARVPDDRKPRRVLPGDYFAVVVNSNAMPGRLPGLFPVFDHSGCTNWGECSLEYYHASRPARPEECPPELLADLERIEPPGPIVYRKRIRHEELQEMWKR